MTTADLSNATTRALRWVLGTGLAAVAAAALTWADLQSHVEQVDVRSAANAVNLGEVRALAKKVDSLVVVLGNQNDILRELRDQQRRSNPK